MKAKVKVIIPSKISTAKQDGESDPTLLEKKLKKLGFFDENGKWKEN